MSDVVDDILRLDDEVEWTLDNDSVLEDMGDVVGVGNVEVDEDKVDDTPTLEDVEDLEFVTRFVDEVEDRVDDDPAPEGLKKPSSSPINSFPRLDRVPELGFSPGEEEVVCGPVLAGCPVGRECTEEEFNAHLRLNPDNEVGNAEPPDGYADTDSGAVEGNVDILVAFDVDRFPGMLSG